MTKSTPLCPNQAILDIELERARQQLVEGWTPEHDDTHDNGELAYAAVVYARHATDAGGAGEALMRDARRIGAPQDWPWSLDWYKPSDRRRDLVKAGALIVAEIERLDRLEAKAKEAGEAQ